MVHNKKQKSKFLNERGFSLLEIVISAGIMTIVASGFALMMQSMTENVAYVEDRQTSGDIRTLVGMDLSALEACENSFGGMPVSAGQVVTLLKNKLDATSYEVGQKFSRVSIESMILRNVDVPATPNGSGRMNFVINLSRANGKKVMSPIEVAVYVNTDASSRINQCSTNESRLIAGAGNGGAQTCNNGDNTFSSAGASRPYSSTSQGTTSDTMISGIQICNANGSWTSMETSRHEREHNGQSRD